MGEWPYVPPDARAYQAFEVTQTFDAIDWYWHDRDVAAGRVPRTHGATDFGNYRCGEKVVAMAPGTVLRVVDPATQYGAATDALGLILDHGVYDGIHVKTEYWHLNGWTVESGWRVLAGQQIGVVGSTGLGNVCHLHCALRLNGVLTDLEPYLFDGKVIGEREINVRIVTSSKGPREGWVVRPGAPFWLNGPEMGEKKFFTTPDYVESIAHSQPAVPGTKAEWYLVESAEHLGDAVVWIRRADLTLTPLRSITPKVAADAVASAAARKAAEF
jgi:hypothetical protein